jgi:hypothetical protein
MRAGKRPGEGGLRVLTSGSHRVSSTAARGTSSWSCGRPVATRGASALRPQVRAVEDGGRTGVAMQRSVLLDHIAAVRRRRFLAWWRRASVMRTTTALATKPTVRLGLQTRAHGPRAVTQHLSEPTVGRPPSGLSRQRTSPPAARGSCLSTWRQGPNSASIGTVKRSSARIAVHRRLRRDLTANGVEVAAQSPGSTRADDMSEALRG